MKIDGTLSRHMAIIMPAAAGSAALLVWAFIARMLYQRKRREAARLREQMLDFQAELHTEAQGKGEALRRKRSGATGFTAG